MKCEEIQSANAEKGVQFSVDLNDQLKACRGCSRANKGKKGSMNEAGTGVWKGLFG